MRIEHAYRITSYIDLGLEKTGEWRGHRICLLRREPRDYVVTEIKNRELAEQRNAELARRISLMRARQLVNAGEPYLHPQLLA